MTGGAAMAATSAIGLAGRGGCGFPPGPIVTLGSVAGSGEGCRICRPGSPATADRL